MSQANVDRAREIMEIFNREGVEATLHFTHPELDVRTFPEWPGADRYRGPDGLVQVVAEWTENFDDYFWKLERFIDAGDRVILLGHQGGLTKGTAVPIEQPVAGVWQFEDDLVVRMDYFMTWAEGLEFAGKGSDPLSVGD